MIDEEALSERSPRTTPEALWEAPGVFVQQTNHGGGSPIVRGMIGPQVLILVEGVRLNNSVYRTGPLQYLNLIDPLSMGGIEVLRGPGSVLYGSDAMGGVINIRLLSMQNASEARPDGQLLVRTGTADAERTIHGHLSMRSGGLSVLGGGTFKAFGDLTGGRDVGRQPYSGYNNWSANANLHYRLIGRRLRLSIAVSYLSSGIDGAGRTDKLQDSGSLQIYDNIDHLLFAKIGLALPQLRTRAELVLSYQYFYEQKDALSMDEQRVISLRTVRDEVTVHTVGLDLQLITRLMNRRLRLRYGGTWYHDLVGSEQQRRDGEGPFRPSPSAIYPDGSKADNFGAFVMLDGLPLDTRNGHRISLTGGYRFHGMGGFAPSREDLSLPEVDTLATGHVFLASLQYLKAERINVAFTFSQGFRAPNLNEGVMLGDTGKYFHIPNHDLEPERSNTFELLTRLRLCRLQLGVAGYVSLIEDLIRREETSWEGQTEVEGKPVAWNVNGGEGVIWGLEARASYELGRGFSLAGNLTYTWGQGRLGDVEDVPMSRIPPLHGQLALRYERTLAGGVDFFAETYLRAAARQDRLSPEDERDVRIPEDGTPAWWIWSVRAGAMIRDVLSLRLSLENLLNETYRYHGSGIYGPGTSALFTVSLHL